MANIVGALAASHSPLMLTSFDKAPEKERERIAKGFEFQRRKVEELKPDVILSISNDHLRELNVSNMPQFLIGIGETVNTLGDWGLPELTYQNNQPLAQHVLTSLIDNEFDMSYSTDLKLDHGHAQILYYLRPEGDIPIIPITINTCAHPFPTFKRCFDLGVKLREAILSYTEDLRVLLIASGGLSHWPSVPKVFNGIPEQAQQLSSENKLTRIRAVNKMRGNINQEWDRWFLDCMANGKIKEICALTTEEVMEKAGEGGQEVRNWTCMWGAVGGSPAQVIAYEAVKDWITGMALVEFQLNKELTTNQEYTTYRG